MLEKSKHRRQSHPYADSVCHEILASLHCAPPPSPAVIRPSNGSCVLSCPLSRRDPDPAGIDLAYCIGKLDCPRWDKPLSFVYEHYLPTKGAGTRIIPFSSTATHDSRSVRFLVDYLGYIVTAARVHNFEYIYHSPAGKFTLTYMPVLLPR